MGAAPEGGVPIPHQSKPFEFTCGYVHCSHSPHSPSSQYVQNNKTADMDWFRLESNKEGTKWFGKCWYVHNLLKYEFDVAFDVRLDPWIQRQTEEEE